MKEAGEEITVIHNPDKTVGFVVHTGEMALGLLQLLLQKT